MSWIFNRVASRPWSRSTKGRRRLLLAGALAAALTGLAVPATAAAPPGGDDPSREISFQAPIDFATGAVPSSTAFNIAHGDQMPLPATRATPLTDSAAVGDFDRDGRDDVAQTNVIAGTVSIFLGNGDSGFAPPRQHPVGVNPVFVVAGDLDVDGNLDLAVANYASNDVAILAGDGKGSFRPAFFVPVPTPRNIAIGELDGDGIPDLAVSSIARAVGPESFPLGGVVILAGDEGGRFRTAQVIQPTFKGRPIGANHVAVGDLDGVGSDDLAIGVGTSPSSGDRMAGSAQLTGDDLLLYFNRNRQGGTVSEPFSTPEQRRIRVGGLPNAIAVADLNVDARPDLAVLSCSGDVTTLLGDGRGNFAVGAKNTSVGALPFSLDAGDFNGDGRLDLVTANWTSSTVSVLRGNGDGTFRPAVDFWSGDATTSAAVGAFNGDDRPDIVAARLRNDHLALLVNESPKRGDGVVVTRDIAYGSSVYPADDPLAAHHTLDVYTPPKGTPSFAGPGRRYPVVFFAHGGGGIAGDKSMASYVMRSLALEGLVTVSVNYRLNERPGQPDEEQVTDVAEAFRWTRAHVGSSEFRGDPDNIFVAGTSAGAILTGKLATQQAYRAEQALMRGLVLVGVGDPITPSAAQPPSLLLNGDQGTELGSATSVAFSQRSAAIGRESTHVVVAGRDHLTIVSDLALADDGGRAALVAFVRSHLASA